MPRQAASSVAENGPAVSVSEAMVGMVGTAYRERNCKHNLHSFGRQVPVRAASIERGAAQRIRLRLQLPRAKVALATTWGPPRGGHDEARRHAPHHDDHRRRAEERRV